MESRQRIRVRDRAPPHNGAQEPRPTPVRSGRGLPFHGRARPKTRAPSHKKKLRFATWNIGTLTGRARELADVLSRRKVAVAFLQETRWKGSRSRLIGNGYKLIYTGAPGGENGVAVVLAEGLHDDILEVKRFSDRLISVKVLIEGVATHLISAYAPQVGCSDAAKISFWNKLGEVIAAIPLSQEIVLGGDLNGHVGEMGVEFERVHGGYGYGSRNAEGEEILRTCAAADLALVNTFFKKKPDHLITYKSGRHATQIDFLITRRHHIGKVANCKVIRQSLTDQHRQHLVMDLCVKPKDKRPELSQRRIRWWMLNEEKSQILASAIGDKCVNSEGESLQEYWDRIQASITDSARIVLDCLHLQLYRDPKDRFKKGQTKASLSLQHFLGFESGFTLDKESNTIAIICQDVTVVLAFETRERLIAWQVKVGNQLGSSNEFLVMIGGNNRKLPAGPARLHLQGRRFALTSGVPPRLLGLWELAHLRRYGVVEGRFCFEGGSHCGKGEGLHLLITDQAQDITDAFDMAAQGNLSIPRTPASRKSNDKGFKTRPSTRMSDFNTVDTSMPDTASALYEENFFGEDCGGGTSFWPSDERRNYGDHDYRTNETEIGAKPPWSGADHVTLERCNNCLTKLGVMSRSSTVALTTGAQFNPAWTMEAVPESSSDNSSNSTEYLTPRAIRKTLESCKCKDKPPDRPPKPFQYEQKKPPAPLPMQTCTCLNDNYPVNNPKVGPYENYDVPKTTHTDIEPSEYYDTPKRLKKALAEDLFQVTKSSTPDSLVLKKNCGCILKFGSRKKPLIVECDENIQPVECPCQKVTNWANNLISLPYCKRTPHENSITTEILSAQNTQDMAIYATVDVTRKTNRQSTADKETTPDIETQFTNYQNVEPKEEKEFEGPYANYENLEFALSLEYYENAKDLLKRAGVTQTELDALSVVSTLPPKSKLCTKCGHSQAGLNKCLDPKKNKSDEYLLMEPTSDVKTDFIHKTPGLNTGYTPMSPNPNWSQSLKHPINKVHRSEIEKSLSIPTLNGSGSPQHYTTGNGCKEAKRSSSVDSARLLEDLKELDSSIGSHATSSSLETLRNMALENRRSSSPCDNDRECYDCCKSSGSENKTSESSSKDTPSLRNKHMDNAQIKRSSSVPCKSGGNRDSSSSNDSGVSSCSLKHGGGEFNEFEMPLTSGHSRYHYMMHKKMRGSLMGCVHSSLPRKSKSSDPLRDLSMQLHKAGVPAKSSSAEAEVPVLPPKQFKGVMDTHSTSSGTSDMSDYIETLSMTSSHSSSDTPTGIRISRQPTNTLRPRSGKEYHNIDPIITSMYKNGKELSNYTNIP